MSHADVNALRQRAEVLMRQAMDAPTESDRRRLITLAAHWHACTLMAARRVMAEQAALKAA